LPCTVCSEFPCSGSGPCSEPPRQDGLDLLNQDTRERLELWRVGCRHLGLVVDVIETGRTEARQAWLYGRGRLDVPYARRGLIVTHVSPRTADGEPNPKARHLLIDGQCAAWDFLITHQRNDAGTIVALPDLWKRGPNAWGVAGSIAVGLGLVWGGEWSFFDLGHIQGDR